MGALQRWLPDPIDCRYNTGLLTCVPVLFGLERAHVTHRECVHKGHRRCVKRDYLRGASCPAF